MERRKIENYHDPQRVVTTTWVEESMWRDDVRIVEADEHPDVYDGGHVPGAVNVDWRRDLLDPGSRDYLAPESFSELVRRLGISDLSTVVFYGDQANWWACFALWVFELFGHLDTRIMDGGREKWVAEGRPLTEDRPVPEPAVYPVPSRIDWLVRAFREDVEDHVRRRYPLVDVRSPEEYRGELLAPPDYPQEGAMLGGHIPGAVNVPWELSVQADGTFAELDSLRSSYAEQGGLKPEMDVITYCRIGERSAHTWFVLRYLLGYRRVRNYDGSWLEWGNLVRAPVER
jgi:thiosulfate/3-mercaptopyruvate sulfurtransferase